MEFEPMIERLLNTLKYAFNFVSEIERLHAKVDRLENAEERRIERDTQIASALRALLKDIENLEKSERLEREKLVLQLENELLKFERRLPPPKSE